MRSAVRQNAQCSGDLAMGVNDLTPTVAGIGPAITLRAGIIKKRLLLRRHGDGPQRRPVLI